ncbi:MAG TPA: hypothetical protein VN376_08425 [Longilinea sp.]|nr:hypothetical protein [Longilinea sp.]
MTVKLILTWNIAAQKEQEYFEFVVRDFIPGLQRLGFDLSDAWATVYGDYPQILVGATLPSLSKAQSLINSGEWISLNNRLQEYVQNYEMKLVPVQGGFQF